MNNLNNSLENQFNGTPSTSAPQTLVQNQISDSSKVGLITSIIQTSIMILIGLIFILGTISTGSASQILELTLISIFLVISPIITLIFCVIALKKPTHINLLVAGILGFLFGGIFGGILTLIGSVENN